MNWGRSILRTWLGRDVSSAGSKRHLTFEGKVEHEQERTHSHRRVSHRRGCGHGGLGSWEDQYVELLEMIKDEWKQLWWSGLMRRACHAMADVVAALGGAAMVCRDGTCGHRVRPVPAKAGLGAQQYGWAKASLGTAAATGLPWRVQKRWEMHQLHWVPKTCKPSWVWTMPSSWARHCSRAPSLPLPSGKGGVTSNTDLAACTLKPSCTGTLWRCRTLQDNPAGAYASPVDFVPKCSMPLQPKRYVDPQHIKELCRLRSLCACPAIQKEHSFQIFKLRDAARKAWHKSLVQEANGNWASRRLLQQRRPLPLLDNYQGDRAAVAQAVQQHFQDKFSNSSAAMPSNIFSMIYLILNAFSHLKKSYARSAPSSPTKLQGSHALAFPFYNTLFRLSLDFNYSVQCSTPSWLTSPC